MNILHCMCPSVLYDVTIWRNSYAVYSYAVYNDAVFDNDHACILKIS